MPAGMIDICRCKLRQFDPSFQVRRHCEVVVVTYQRRPVLYFDLESGEIDAPFPLEFGLDAGAALQMLARRRAAVILTFSVVGALLEKVKGDLSFKVRAEFSAPEGWQGLVAYTWYDDNQQQAILGFRPITPITVLPTYKVLLRWKHFVQGHEKRYNIRLADWLESGTPVLNLITTAQI
jgi:hypothetical protein